MNLLFERAKSFAVPNAFYQVLNEAFLNAEIPTQEINAITFNFKDPNYSADAGGYHSIEIRIEKVEEKWRLAHITNFSYQGKANLELSKEIDVCFTTHQVFDFILGGLLKYHASYLVTILVKNFIQYYRLGVFDVTVQFE